MEIPSGESVARFDYDQETAAHRAEIRARDRAWEINGRVVQVALPDSGIHLVFPSLAAAGCYLDLLAHDIGRTRYDDRVELTPPGASFRSVARVIADWFPPAALRAPNMEVYAYRAPEEQSHARLKSFAHADEIRGQVIACQLSGGCGGYVVATDLAAAQRYLDLLVERFGGVRRDERSAVIPQPGFAPQVRILDAVVELQRASLVPPEGGRCLRSPSPSVRAGRDRQ